MRVRASAAYSCVVPAPPLKGRRRGSHSCLSGKAAEFPLSIYPIQRAPETSAHLEATTSSFRRFLPRTSVILSRSAQRTRSYNYFPGKAYALWLVRKMRRRSRDIGISGNRPPRVLLVSLPTAYARHTSAIRIAVHFRHEDVSILRWIDAKSCLVLVHVVSAYDGHQHIRMLLSQVRAFSVSPSVRQLPSKARVDSARPLCLLTELSFWLFNVYVYIDKCCSS